MHLILPLFYSTFVIRFFDLIAWDLIMYVTFC